MNPQIAKLLDQQDAITKQLRVLLSFPKVPLGLKEIEAMFGKPGDEKNIVLFDLPYPLKYDGVTVTRSRCHKLMVPVFKAVLSELKARGLEKYVQNYGGIYNHRPIDDSTKLSTHSWGIAIDVEPQKYPAGSTARIQAEVIEVFARYGFVYGGDFPTPDPMHFQYATDY
jgi:D-alanyl-D-alanine carboxypeptidase-like protein